MENPARLMTDNAIAAELKKLDGEWDSLRSGLEESGGMSGSPGEWIIERMDELNAERRRRLISLDGDIGRAENRH